MRVENPSADQGKIFKNEKSCEGGLIFEYIVVFYIIIKISTVSHLLMGEKAVSRCPKDTASVTLIIGILILCRIIFKYKIICQDLYPFI